MQFTRPSQCQQVLCYIPADNNDVDELTNLFQQITRSILYCSLLHPKLQFNAAQLCKVMSRPTEEHLSLAQQVLMYIKGTINDKLTFRPAGCDGSTEADVSLRFFSDSDWACAIDTRRSHGCHLLMLRSGHRVAQQIAKICHAKHSCHQVLPGVRGLPRNCVRPRHPRGFLRGRVNSDTTIHRQRGSDHHEQAPPIYGTPKAFQSESAIWKNAPLTSSSNWDQYLHATSLQT